MKQIELTLSNKLSKALQKEAEDARQALEVHIAKKLERITPPIEGVDRKRLEKNFPKLVVFLERIPSVEVVSHKVENDAFWWIKLRVDTAHPLAWRVVQELGFVLNYISISEKLPTVFKPVSPPPYLNGGIEFLAWVIESTYNYIDPNWILGELEGRLPNPVDDETKWEV